MTPTSAADNQVRIEDLHKRYGKSEVLKGINLEVRAGSATVLLGPSGSGKTTLLRCINLLEEYESGCIYLGQQLLGYEQRGNRRVRLSEGKLARERADIGIVFQSLNLFPHMTALENVCLGLIKVRGLSRADAQERGRQVLSRVGLADKLNDFPNHLSGGQQQRVAIARALAMQTKVILFDEVTSALDPELVGEVLAVMRELAEGHGVTMIIVTHELQFARDVADHAVFMDAGKIVEEGKPAELFGDPKTERLRTFLRGFAR
jgi:polar amino acid transport system ATP-binding protein